MQRAYNKTTNEMVYINKDIVKGGVDYDCFEFICPICKQEVKPFSGYFKKDESQPSLILEDINVNRENPHIAHFRHIDKNDKCMLSILPADPTVSAVFNEFKKRRLTLNEFIKDKDGLDTGMKFDELVSEEELGAFILNGRADLAVFCYVIDYKPWFYQAHFTSDAVHKDIGLHPNARVAKTVSTEDEFIYIQRREFSRTEQNSIRVRLLKYIQKKWAEKIEDAILEGTKISPSVNDMYFKYESALRFYWEEMSRAYVQTSRRKRKTKQSNITNWVEI